MRDAYYTPEALAQEVIAAARITPGSIMDPAVGDGSLLHAATVRWPDARVVGLDVDRQQLERTRTENPGWSLGRVDMFLGRSRAGNPLWRSSSGEIDLMLLNPPFSYRGGRSRYVAYENKEFSLTPASAFVALALTRLAAEGELLALLPAGVLSLERDAAFWSAVTRGRTVETVAQFASTAFSGTRARSILVAVRPQVTSQTAEILDLPVRARVCVELVRGRIPVHTVTDGKVTRPSAPFLHTRDLAGVSRRATTAAQADASLGTRGPFLTLPRVGRVRPEHIKVVTSPRVVVLSDCVFAIRTRTDAGLAALQESLLSELQSLQAEYVGGCAPYLTIRRLVHFLALRGYCCHHVSASSAPRLAVQSPGCSAERNDLRTASSDRH